MMTLKQLRVHHYLLARMNAEKAARIANRANWTNRKESPLYSDALQQAKFHYDAVDALSTHVSSNVQLDAAEYVRNPPKE